jgi:hypothetical protein|tara:strand:- start:186 stop:608 length:423 start_codon:yes stop_codon:yes gene_type:complete
MDINLRKAATLQEQVRQAISDISLDTRNDGTGRVVEDDLVGRLTRIEELESVLYSLRDKVGKANVETGVSTLLTKRVQLNNLISRYEKLVRNGHESFKIKLSDFRRERVKISENILELNVGSSVNIADADVEILNKENII